MAEQLLDLSKWRVGNADLLQDLGILRHLHGESDMLQFVTGLRVANEIYCRISDADTIKVYQMQCYAAIADFMKKHPKASESEIATEVGKQVEIFRQKVERL